LDTPSIVATSAVRFLTFTGPRIILVPVVGTAARSSRFDGPTTAAIA
jgi:hypothetical protein